MTDLTDRINIGKDTAAKLIKVGINSIDELTTLGTEQAFIRLQALDAGACMCLLYSVNFGESIPPISVKGYQLFR